MPEDDRIMYKCSSQPRHISVAVDTLNYTLPYDELFGGVTALTLKDFLLVNGYSNMYRGWGGEDDDMHHRLSHKKLHILRHPANVSRYTMLKHGRIQINKDRYKYLKTSAMRMNTDGYNSLKYKILKYERRKLYTWVLTDLF